MNYLAHAYLSGNDTGLLVGNFIADGVRGNKIAHFPEEVRRGIKLHRLIDSFTDEHPVNAEMRSMFYPTAGKYAGVVLDVFYDHLLADNWAHFSPESLEDFVEHCYQVVELSKEWFPERTAYMFPYMRQFNWLLNYRLEEGIMRSLGGLSRRITGNPELEAAGRVAFANKHVINAGFMEFFPQLINFCEQKRTEPLTFS
ncbi:MAG: ACP phosphodiesterase [Bacteroidota bacterium]